MNTEMKSIECRQQILDMLVETTRDIMQVFDFGAQKHPDSGDTPNFLTPNGNKCSLMERGSGVLRHGARTFMNPGKLDDESGLSEYLHLLASVAILYIRHKRNITHPLDVVGDTQHADKTP
jgi:hypothetical protein